MIQYLAGIFDSEGYVRIRKITSKTTNKVSYISEIRIYMCNKEIVEQFSKIYNLKVYTGDRGKYRKISYCVIFNNKTLNNCSFLTDLLPYVNEKRLQLQCVFDLLNNIKPKEECYQDYLIYKTKFDHPVINIPSYEYLAGIIDGDGWFSMFKSAIAGHPSMYNKYSIGLQQRYRPMIEFMSNFGGSTVHKCKVYDYQSHIQTYSWQCTTALILPFIEKIAPFLIEKKEKAYLFIDYIKKHEEFKIFADETLLKYKHF